MEDKKHVKKENGSHAGCDQHIVIPNSFRTERPGNYLCKIESFSFLLYALAITNRDKYELPHFDAGGYKWKLSLYPNGDKKRGGDGYVSLSLALAEPKSLPQGGDVRVFVNFSVYDYLRDNYLVLQDGKEKRFHVLKTEWCLAKFIPLEIFNDPSQGYLMDDFCAFGVDIFINNIEREGEFSLSKYNLATCESTFTWKIDKFSKLSEKQVSKEFSVGGLKWSLDLYPKGDHRANGSSLSLFLYVHDHSSFPSGSNIYAEYKLSILDQINKKHFERTVAGYRFSTSDGYGYHEFIPLSDLKDASRGFIVNDTVVVEVKIMCLSVVNSLP